MDNFAYQMLINASGTLLGGLVLTLVLFLLKEYVFDHPNLTGEWTARIKIESSSYNAFSGLAVEYKLHLLQKGNELYGSGEKIRDIHADGNETVFERDKRVLVEVTGWYEWRYFRKSRVQFNVVEAGRLRQSRATYCLSLNNPTLMSGTFVSTAADASGTVTVQRI